MSFWACAQLETHREHLALHFLGLNGFSTYCPRIRAQRSSREGERSTWLFPGYTFVAIELQWHAARRCPGIVKLILDGERPAKVPMSVIDDLKSRERNGYVVLPQARGLQRGDKVRVTHGPLNSNIAIFDGMRPHQRVAILLSVFGAARQVELPKASIRPVA
jgi:transcription antitermination factor NusG